MAPFDLFTIFIALSWALYVAGSTDDDAPCKHKSGKIQGVSFSIYGRTNLTGYRTHEYVIKKSCKGLTKDWNVDLDETEEEVEGIKTIRIRGTFTQPPGRPTDYEKFPGVGFYKFHHEERLPFQEAYGVCAQEGGHLAIINSQEESDVITSLYKRHQRSAASMSYIGLHDPKKNRIFTTVFGERINSTAFTNWSPGEPADARLKQFCVYVKVNGLWGDIECSGKYSFFCEYDLQWGSQEEKN